MNKIVRFICCALILQFFNLYHFLGVLYPDSENNKVVFTSSILETEKKLYSQHDEELIIRDFFNDRQGGIFVDVGCAHYEENSTTYYLEKHLGWSGIAVDALGEYVIGYIDNRPNTRFFNFMVTDHADTIEPFYRLINARGLSSVNENYVRYSAQYWKKKPAYQTIYVPTITLNELLERNKISKIDFLSMDIEGGELKALAGFDIQRFSPSLVCIEKWIIHRPEIFDYFIRNGYEEIKVYRIYDPRNAYFKPVGDYKK